MNPRHAICLVVDGLRASALGTYGNTTYRTPNLDALSSQSVVADWLWADSPRLEDFYRAVWQGSHASRPAQAERPASLLHRLGELNVQRGAMTDDVQFAKLLANMPLEAAIQDEVMTPEAVADDLESTSLAQFFTAAIEWLSHWQQGIVQQSSFSWLHCSAMFGPWDAPLEIRAELLDEEDPDPLEIVIPPGVLKTDDPDELLLYRTAYAAQVKVLDACVGALVAAIEEIFAGQETLLMLVGSRGFALGEHGAVGSECESLFSERLHLPWLMTKVGETTPLPRLGTLCQPADVVATLLQWFDKNALASWCDGLGFVGALQDEVLPTRTLAVACGADSETAIRTPAWSLRSTENVQQLFSKPDDRWESNDVADRCPEVVEGLRAELEAFHAAARDELTLPLQPADAELATSDG